MADREPFSFDPENVDRFLRAAGDQLRDTLGAVGRQFGRTGVFDAGTTRATAGETGEGVWAVYTLDAGGGARVEQVFAAELDALRANQHNTDGRRRVRFLPYGIPVSVLDAGEDVATD